MTTQNRQKPNAKTEEGPICYLEFTFIPPRDSYNDRTNNLPIMI